MLRTADGETTVAESRPAHWLHWLLWLGFVTGWTIALLTPQPVELAREMLPDEALFPSFKLAHLGCYAFLAGFGLRLIPNASGRGWLLAFASGHAFLTEFLQQFVPGRTATLFDVGVDHLGIAAGVLIAWRSLRSGCSGKRSSLQTNPQQAA